jgi:hypothetical protein
MVFCTEEEIRVRAYYLWEANGRPEGRDLEFWASAQQSMANGNHRDTQPAERRPRSGKAGGGRTGDQRARRGRRNK